MPFSSHVSPPEARDPWIGRNRIEAVGVSIGFELWFMNNSLFCLFVFIVQVQLSPFSCHHFPLPHPPPPPCLNPTPLCLCLWVLYTYSLATLLLLSPVMPLLFPLWLLSVCSYFNVSGYILLTCLFCWLGSTYRWDHMVFVFHCLAYFA